MLKSESLIQLVNNLTKQEKKSFLCILQINQRKITFFFLD